MLQGFLDDRGTPLSGANLPWMRVLRGKGAQGAVERVIASWENGAQRPLLLKAVPARDAAVGQSQPSSFCERISLHPRAAQMWSHRELPRKLPQDPIQTPQRGALSGQLLEQATPERSASVSHARTAPPRSAELRFVCPSAPLCSLRPSPMLSAPSPRSLKRGRRLSGQCATADETGHRGGGYRHLTSTSLFTGSSARKWRARPSALPRHYSNYRPSIRRDPPRRRALPRADAFACQRVWRNGMGL